MARPRLGRCRSGCPPKLNSSTTSGPTPPSIDPSRRGAEHRQQYRNYPVDRWRERFASGDRRRPTRSKGKDPAAVSDRDRDHQQQAQSRRRPRPPWISKSRERSGEPRRYERPRQCAGELLRDGSGVSLQHQSLRLERRAADSRWCSPTSRNACSWPATSGLIRFELAARVPIQATSWSK